MTALALWGFALAVLCVSGALVADHTGVLDRRWAWLGEPAKTHR